MVKQWRYALRNAFEGNMISLRFNSLIEKKKKVKVKRSKAK